MWLETRITFLHLVSLVVLGLILFEKKVPSVVLDFIPIWINSLFLSDTW